MARLLGHDRRDRVPALPPGGVGGGQGRDHALFTKDHDALEDPDSYPLAREATEIDLRPAVREELLLAVPQWGVLCQEDCRGLCPRCGRDLNAGPCGCAPAVDHRWQELAAFKGKLRE